MATYSSSPSLSSPLAPYTSTATTNPPSNTTESWQPPPYTSFPPFYTLQPNLTTLDRQLSLWSSLILSYCTYHRLYKLSLSSPPPNLFTNPTISRSLSPQAIRKVLDYMSRPENGSRIDWIAPASKGEQSSSCWVLWKSLGEWADVVYGWVEGTGQKGAVLTIYELKEEDANGGGTGGREWLGMEEGLLRKVLGVLVKRGKAQVFGEEGGGGVKFF